MSKCKYPLAFTALMNLPNKPILWRENLRENKSKIVKKKFVKMKEDKKLLKLVKYF